MRFFKVLFKYLQFKRTLRICQKIVNVYAYKFLPHAQRTLYFLGIDFICRLFANFDKKHTLRITRIRIRVLD
jgi:hypothetical protein